MVRRSPRRTKQKGGRMNKPNWEKNEGYFGKVMDKNGKLNRDEICHNCWPSGYAKEARKFCKLHDKVWEPKTNSCRKKKTKKQKGGRKIEKEFSTITPELKKCQKECKKKQKTHKKECLKEYKDWVKDLNRLKYWKKNKLHISNKKAEQMFSENYVGACSSKCLKDKGFLDETKKQKGGRKRTLKNLTPEELEYFKEFPNLTTARKNKLLKDPCWPSIESPECVKLMVKDNPWMLEEGGDKYAQGVVGKKSPLLKEIKKKKKKAGTKAGTKPGTKSSKSTKIKYNKYTKCLEDCKLKHKYSINKNKKHVCKDQCRIYKTIKIKTSKIDNKKKSSEIKPKKQKGGALCLPCISPILSGLGVIGTGVAATAGAITMTSSKMSQSGDNIEREQSFEKKTSRTHKKSKKSKKSEEKLKFHITQKNNKVTYKRNNEKMKTKVFTKSKSMKDNINKATNFYNKKIKYCATKGYKKC